MSANARFSGSESHRHGENRAGLLATYVSHSHLQDIWPFDLMIKHRQSSTIRRLEIAGALIAAEIDRLLRAGER